ncbi:MAG: hypothetical protein ACD_40C00056G0003 [uncultured bacterium]|nr:MAG: hypothetical protein ACD_40C00056G0003 [uncultured bacterium]
MGKKLLGKVKAIGFDVDGTLYASTTEMSHWIGQAVVQRGAEQLRRPVDEFKEDYLQKLAELRSNTLTLTSFGLRGEKIFEWIWDNIPLHKFVNRDVKLIKIMDSLRKRYSLFILSNGSGVQVENKLKILGLDPSIFDPRIYCYDHGWVKPEPAPFLAVVDALALKPEEVVYVGDRVSVDIEGAKSVGMKTILVGGESELATECCETVFDIVSIL